MSCLLGTSISDIYENDKATSSGPIGYCSLLSFKLDFRQEGLILRVPLGNNSTKKINVIFDF